MPPKNKKKTQETQHTDSKKSTPETKKPTSSSTNSDKKASTNEKQWSDPTFNDSELTMSQLKDMIKTLATEVYKKSYEELKEDMEEEVEWRVTAQCEELEETVEKLKKEISSIKEEREKMKKDIFSIKEEREKMKKEISSIKEEKEALKIESTKLKRMVERCEYKLASKVTKIQDLQIKLDEVEQKHLERDLQLVGVPEIDEGQETEEEEMKTIVKLVQEKMNITLKNNSIEKIHRLGRRRDDKPRDIVVRFRTNIIRNKLFRNRKMTVNNADSSKNVYINDHLTEFRRNVFYAARQLVKKKTVFAAWSQQGNILIRITENDQPIHVRSHRQLAEMKLIDNMIRDNIEDSDDEDDEY